MVVSVLLSLQSWRALKLVILWWRRISQYGFALYVDTLPDEAIPKLNKWLEQLPKDNASIFAQHFVTTLTGKFRHGEERTSFTGGVRNPSSLKHYF